MKTLKNNNSNNNASLHSQINNYESRRKNILLKLQLGKNM